LRALQRGAVATHHTAPHRAERAGIVARGRADARSPTRLRAACATARQVGAIPSTADARGRERRDPGTRRTEWTRIARVTDSLAQWIRNIGGRELGGTRGKCDRRDGVAPVGTERVRGRRRNLESDLGTTLTGGSCVSRVVRRIPRVGWAAQAREPTVRAGRPVGRCRREAVQVGPATTGQDEECSRTAQRLRH